MGPDFQCWSLGHPPLCPLSLIKPALQGRLFRFYRASIPFDSVAGLRRRFGGHGAAAETHNSYSDSHSCLARFRDGVALIARTSRLPHKTKLRRSQK
jgi:hypothetical protein